MALWGESEGLIFVSQRGRKVVERYGWRVAQHSRVPAAYPPRGLNRLPHQTVTEDRCKAYVAWVALLGGAAVWLTGVVHSARDRRANPPVRIHKKVRTFAATVHACAWDRRTNNFDEIFPTSKTDHRSFHLPFRVRTKTCSENRTPPPRPELTRKLLCKDTTLTASRERSRAQGCEWAQG